MLPPQTLDPEAIIAVQAGVIAELRTANRALQAQVVALEAANAEQARGIAVLARVAELERRLGQDSSNSSRPLSQDGLRKPVRSKRHGSGDRKPGKQPGAPGAHLAQVAEPDEIVVHVADRCGGCGGELAGALLAGVEAFLTVRSYISTARKHEVEVLGVLRRLFPGQSLVTDPGGDLNSYIRTSVFRNTLREGTPLPRSSSTGSDHSSVAHRFPPLSVLRCLHDWRSPQAQRKG
jgi:Family of unknown function (DUF6444)